MEPGGTARCAHSASGVRDWPDAPPSARIGGGLPAELGLNLPWPHVPTFTPGLPPTHPLNHNFTTGTIRPLINFSSKP